MDAYGVVDLKHVDFDKITFLPPKIGKRKSKNCGIRYDGKKFLVRLPTPLNAPFGMSEFRDEETGNCQYSLELSLGENYENDEHFRPVYEFFKTLDERIREEAKKNSWEWLGERNADDVHINMKYRSFFRVSKNKTTGDVLNYPPRIKFNMRLDNGKFITKGIYDAATSTKCEITVDNFKDMIPKGTDVRCVFEVGSVWSTNIGFGARLNLYQARLYKSVNLDEDICGEDDDSVLIHIKKKRKVYGDEEEDSIVDEAEDIDITGAPPAE